MIGTTSLMDASCLQFPVQPNAILELTQATTQGPNTALWFQQNSLQQQQQGTFVLPHCSQADLDPSLWALQQTTDLDSLAQMLQHSNGIISLQFPQSTGIAMDGRQVVFQVQSTQTNTQPMQQVSAGLKTHTPMQQVLLTASGEQLLVLGGGHDTMPQQQQGLVCVNPCVNPCAGNSPSMDLQLQQLQDAISSLSNQTTAVQQVLLDQQCSQPQDSSPTMGPMGNLELASALSPSAPSFSGLALPAQPTATAMTNSSFTGSYSQDSLSSSSWQCLDPSSGSNSCNGSPLHRLQGTALLGASPGVSTTASALGSSKLSILSSPQMPQPGGAVINITPMSSPQIRPYSQATPQMHGQMQGGGSSSSSSGTPTANNSWNAAGSGMGISAGGIGQQAAAAHMGGQRILLPGGHVLDYGSSVLQHPQRASGLGGATVAGGPHMSHMQGLFRGNTPFRFSQGRTAHAPPPRSPALPAKPAAAKAAQGGSATTAGGAAGAHVAPAQGAKSAAAGGSAGTAAPSYYAHVSLQEGLAQLWSSEQLQGAAGGHLFNVQQLAWHPVGEPDPDAQDMYNFQKLKRMVQKLDAVHKTRVKLIKRIHAVADYGCCDLKSVYREVRGLIGEMLHDSAMQIRSLEECRVTGLVRMALLLQEALTKGPRSHAAAEATPGGM